VGEGKAGKLKAQSSKLKAQSSKLKAQSSKLKAQSSNEDLPRRLAGARDHQRSGLNLLL
jgi:hypothetical protein